MFPQSFLSLHTKKQIKAIRAYSAICFLVALIFGVQNAQAEVTQQIDVGENIGSSVALDENGQAYFGSADGSLYALSEEGVVWKTKLGSEIGATPAVGKNGSVYVGSYDGNLYAVDAETGDKVWTFETGSPIYSSPAISLDGAVLFGNKAGSFFAIDSTSGHELWRVNTGSEIGGSPAIGTRGNVYFGVADGTLYGVDVKSGVVKVSQMIGEGAVSPAISWHGVVYAGSKSGVVKAIDPDDGVLWSSDAGGAIAAAPVINNDGAAYFASLSGKKVYRISPDGSSTAAYNLPAEVYSTPAIGADGSVYVATLEGQIISLKFVGGEFQENFKEVIDGSFYSSVTLSGTGDLLLVSREGEFIRYSYTLADGDADPQWTMFGNSEKHTRVYADGDRDNCPDAIDDFPNDINGCMDSDGDGEDDRSDTDDDNDGLSDSYEIANGLDPLTTDAEDDSDGDGYSNKYEHDQGLNPSENEFDDRPVELLASLDTLTGAERVRVHPSGDFVLVVGEYGLRTYERDADTGALTELASTSLNGFEVDAITFSASGQDVYAYGETGGYSDTTQVVRQYKLDSSGALTLASSVEFQDWVSVAEQQPGIPYTGYSNAHTRFALSPTGEQLYLGLGRTGVLIFDRDADTGVLTFREHFRNGESSFDARYGLVMSADGSTLYAQGSRTQWVLDRDSETGALSMRRSIETTGFGSMQGEASGNALAASVLYIAPIPGLGKRDLIAIDQDSELARIAVDTNNGYVASNPTEGIAYTYADNTLRAYYREGDQFTLLSTLTGTELPELQRLAALAASPDGRHVYGVSRTNDRLVVLSGGYKGIGRPDQDGDGVEDIFDAFPEDPAESVDTDHDGEGNVSDDDDDNDGYKDTVDAFPLDKTEWLDTDGDGVGNNADEDADDDGYDNDVDSFPLDATEWSNADHDELGDNADTDDDNDNIPDEWELANGLNPLDGSDASRNDDDDELTNLEEYENDSDPTLADTDNDGYLDHDDEAPRDSEEHRDHDDDGIGDVADLDDDNDGLSDTCEVQYQFDPLVAAPEGQDTDGDTVPDSLECQAGSDPTAADGDGDGMRDDFELAYGLDPLVDDAAGDLDGDGYTNAYEYNQGLDPSENEFDDRPVTFLESQGTLNNATRVLVDPTGQYVLVEAEYGLRTYARDADTGNLTGLTTLALNGFEVDAITFSVTGQDVYAYGSVGGGYTYAQQVRHYELGSDGSLVETSTIVFDSWVEPSEQQPGVPYTGYPSSRTTFASSPSGKQLYLGLKRAGILIFDRDTETGVLTFREHFTNDETRFNAENGLVMSEDGATLYAQGDSGQWLLNRDPATGLLSVHRHAAEGASLKGLAAGSSDNTIQYLTSTGIGKSDLVAIDRDSEVARSTVDFFSGIMAANPAAGMTYTYADNTLRAYYRRDDRFALLGTLAGTELPELQGLRALAASPDGRHVYGVSSINDQLVVLSGGYKGIGQPDSDDDGVPDKDDAFPFDPAEWLDSDGDGHGDNSDEFPNNRLEWADYDSDGHGDNSDTDIDGDECLNDQDEFDFDETECFDHDGDGTGDNADTDDDDDRLPDEWEKANGLNPFDAGDAGLDKDGDGLSNEDEYHFHHTFANNPDSDQDNISDGWEVTYGLDPLDSSDSELDFDSDGYSSFEEYVADTDPNDPRWYPGAPGLQKWVAETSGAIRTRAAVDNNGTSYVGSDDGSLRAFDADGNALWELDLGSPVRSSPVLTSAGNILIGSGDGRLLKVSPINPYEPEVLATASGSITTTPAISAGGVVYFGSEDGNVYAISSDSGQELWSYDTGAPVHSSPRIGADGVIYIGSDSGEYHAINGDTGAPVN